jgi:hypothetical protein
MRHFGNPVWETIMLKQTALLKTINEGHPHLAGALIASWGKPEFDGRVDELLSDWVSGTGPRLSAKVASALTRLKQEHDLDFPQHASRPKAAPDAEVLTQTAQFRIINQRFPHIGRALKRLWGGTEFSKFIVSLFNDTRNGTRQGFPATIAVHLFRLIQAHDKSFPPAKEVISDIWSLGANESLAS